jgi:hypothetical protein
MLYELALHISPFRSDINSMVQQMVIIEQVDHNYIYVTIAEQIKFTNTANVIHDREWQNSLQSTMECWDIIGADNVQAWSL